MWNTSHQIDRYVLDFKYVEGFIFKRYTVIEIHARSASLLRYNIAIDFQNIRILEIWEWTLHNKYRMKEDKVIDEHFASDLYGKYIDQCTTVLILKLQYW